MKLVCDSCGAKYSIGDDRVSGKVFKVRCKKCSHVMVIRGGTDAAVPESPPPSGPPGWHVVHDGAQVGPLSREDLLRRHAAGELTGASLVWREGMADWNELATVAALQDNTPAVEAQPLVHARNETSLLFTLDKLAQLAAPPAPTTPTSTFEGSGLIDIRKIAAAYVAPVHAPHLPTRASERASLATPAIAFAEPIAIAPLSPIRRATDRRLVIALVATTLMLAVLAVVLVVVLSRGDREPAPVVGTPPQATRVATAEPVRPTHPAPTAQPSTDVTPSPSPKTVEPPVPAPPPAARRPPTPSRTPAPARRPPPAHVTTPNPLVRPAPDNRCTEVSCIVNGYKDECCRIFDHATTTPPAPATRALPDSLDRAALGKGIATIHAQSCGGRSPPARGRPSARGDVAVSVRVAADGSVAGVTIKRSPDPVLSACVETAAKAGVFPKSKRGATFAYLWRF